MWGAAAAACSTPHLTIRPHTFPHFFSTMADESKTPSDTKPVRIMYAVVCWASC